MSKVNISWQGMLVLVVSSAVGYFLYKAIKGVGNVTTAVGEAVGGSVYTAINGDPNAAIQSNFQAFHAAWLAAGKPATGSAAELQLRQQYGIAAPPSSQTAASTVAGGGGSGS